MSENSQHPVRIVYHAENRTFARLFNERSLDQVKDVVRRKLGLGRDTDVSLKQMWPNALLDLEDDDDFQAFCILLKSSDSVDIQVTVGKSQGAAVAPSIVPPREEPSAGEPLATSLVPPEEPVPPAQPAVATTTKVSTATKKTSEPSARKRKVSFSGGDMETSEKPAEKHRRSKSTATVSVEPLAAEEPIQEPLKKRRKKEKATEAPPTEAAESTPMKASDIPKPKVRKRTTLNREREAGASAPKDTETSEQPVKKPRKKTVKQSEPIETDDETPEKTSEAGSKSKAGEGEKEKAILNAPTIGVCASIPQTSESTSVLFEVAAAILSKASKIPPPKPPAKRKYVRKTITKTSTSSRTPVESTSVLHTSANEIPAAPTQRRLEAVVPTSDSLQRAPELTGPPCPICLEVPFHIRYYCPTVQKGPDAIRKRLEELKKTNTNDQQALIKELEDLLRDSEVTSEPAEPTNAIQSREASQTPDASVSRTPNIPSNSCLSEVTVESRNEGSSSESYDGMSEGEIIRKGLPASRRQETSDERPSPSNDGLEAVIRGPASQHQSVLGVLDRVVGDEDDEVSDSEEDKAELEEGSDEEVDRSRRRLSQPTPHSSDSENEEEFRSPLSSRSGDDVSNSLKSGAHDSNKLAEKSVKHKGNDVIVMNSLGPSVLEGQDGDSNEETHVGSEDRMVVDGSIGEKGATTVEERLSPVPHDAVLPSFDAQEPHVSGKMADGPMSDQGNNLEVPELDPIDPADEMVPDVTHLLNPDPIETPSEDVGSFAGVTQSTPASGVARRLKTRHGQVLDDEAERPVLLDQLSLEEPLSTKRKSRRKDMKTPNSQEPVTTRKSPRFSALPPATGTPVAVSLLNHRAKAKVAKTPAKQSGAGDEACIAAMPSLTRWETLADSSPPPPIQPDESPALLDELMSSSPHPESNPVLKRPKAKGPEKKDHPRASQEVSSQEKQRLFDLTPSQVPFPYSQHKNPVSVSLPNGKETEVLTDSEEEPKTTKKEQDNPFRRTMTHSYRKLSQLASQATLYSPSLPTPTNKNVTNGRAKKRPAAEDSSSSSSSSEEEANESTHIPRDRRAGSVLETKKRKKSIFV